MSQKKKNSFRFKAQLQCNKRSALSETDVSKIVEKYKTIEDRCRSIGSVATVDINVVTSENGRLNSDPMLKPINKTDVNSNSIIDTQLTKKIESESRTDSDCSQRDSNPSLAIPDGMVVDPLAPSLEISTDLMDRIGSGLTLLRDHGKKFQKYVWKNRKFEFIKKSDKSMVNVVLIEAKDLVDDPANGSSGLYCKFKLGNEGYKSKQVSKSKPMWCERFNLCLHEDYNLEITMWQKGKEKAFMGRCAIDFSQLQKERTHDVWQKLECGNGALHMSITLNRTSRTIAVDNVPTANGIVHPTPAKDEFSWYRLDNNWSEVGQLSITVFGAKGLSPIGLGGKANAYCVLELDNSRVQTHTVSGTSEPMWNKNFTFGINDITSTLDIKVNDESLLGETLGKISIPLLRVSNDEKKWYALKDKSKKSNAKGNCPRILLQMSIVWNPIKASLRVLSPKERKYTKKSPIKFNIPLIYYNLVFVKNILQTVQAGNEHLKYLFEWDSREKSAIALLLWLVFWVLFQMWMTPLLLVAPFIYCALRNRDHSTTISTNNTSDDESNEEDLESTKDEQTIKSRIYELQDLTFTIKDGIDYIVSIIERIKNLLNFTVPYLSTLVIAAMFALTLALYFIPVNYLFAALGIYKFTRKYLNPDRVPNNDILDFISRVPDDKILKQWQELKVPEQNSHRAVPIRNR